MVQKVEIIRGTTNTLQIDVVDATGTPYEIGTGETIVFGIKRNITDAEPFLVKVAYVDGAGIYSVRLFPEDTEGLSCGKYIYDVGMKAGANYFNIIEPSPFVIKPEVTSWGCST